MSETDDRFDWDSISEEEEQEELVLLPPGDYTATVVSFEKGFYKGDPDRGKLPCKMAHICLKADGGELGKSLFSVNFYLRDSSKWLIRNFFKSLGLIKTGYKGILPWNYIKGESARVHLYVREYVSKGEQKKTNDVDKWYPHKVIADEDADVADNATTPFDPDNLPQDF